MIQGFNEVRRDSRSVILIALIISGIKVLLLPFAQTVDADAVSRIFLSIDWLNQPQWIATSVWAPFHFYLNGVALSIIYDPIITPKILQILLAGASLIPFFYFVRREFNSRGAVYATILFGLSPILFRNSFMCLSETPYLLFLVLSLNLISKSLKEQSVAFMALAGLFFTIASGFRYEAWILMFLTGSILLYYDWKKAFVFGFFALLFPFIWMYSNYLYTGDPFYSISGNYKWTLEVMGNNDQVDTETMIRRIWFFPFSWFISLGPPVAYLTLKSCIQSLKGLRTRSTTAIWAILFFIMLAFFIYNSTKGVLLLQHRFIGTLVVFSLPFIALRFQKKESAFRKFAIYFVLMLSLSFVYNTNGITPVPRLGDQKKTEIANEIRNKKEQAEFLIIDFIGWEYSYFTALNSGIDKNKILLFQEKGTSEEQINGAVNKIRSGEEVILVLRQHSELSKCIEAEVDLSKGQLLYYDAETRVIMLGNKGDSE